MLPKAKAATGVALACEAAGDWTGAFDAWQDALNAEPGSLDIVARLADLAFRLKQFDMAEKFYAHLITQGVQGAAVIAAYAGCLREQGHYDDAVGLLKNVLGNAPHEAVLWDTLGTLMAAKGDGATALVFHEEALRLAPGDLQVRFNRAVALMENGQMRAGLRDAVICAEGFDDAGNRASAELTCAQGALALGELASGWRWYEARHRVRPVRYDIPLPRWHGEALEGKRLFISAEQGLGDEVMFGSLLPQIMTQVSALGIGVEPRLVSLFQRSFPEAQVVAHRTQTIAGKTQRTFIDCDWQAFDGWALMGDFLSLMRSDINDFPAENVFLTPAAGRVDHWHRALSLADDKPKIGILWKSLKSGVLRDRFFSPFEQWREVLSLGGVRFVNLQYGDSTAEMAEARGAGIDILQPDGIDLKDDLDDLAALCRACDLIIGPSNATTNIAAACGAAVWLLSPPDSWPRLNADRYPWYPTARVFAPLSLSDWSPAMADIRAALHAAYATN